MSKASDAAKIIRRIKECEGEKISHKIEEPHATFFIFSENRKQLLTAISAFEHPPNITTIWKVENRLALRRFHEEIARLPHNYLASAATLIDHTRIFAHDLYQGKPFHDEYKNKIADTFKTSELAGVYQGTSKLDAPQTTCTHSCETLRRRNSYLSPLCNCIEL